MIATLFAELMQQCYISGVKKYLKEKGLPFKNFLLIDNTPNRLEFLRNQKKQSRLYFYF